MTRSIVVALGLLLSQTGAWTVLFDGKNLDQWTPIGEASSRLADGVVETSGTGPIGLQASGATVRFRSVQIR